MITADGGARIMLVAAAGGGFCAVATGAFGAHGLRGQLEPELLQVFLTATQYLMFHSLALLGLGVAQAGPLRSRWFARAGWCFVSGMVLFCGSLFALALSGLRPLGAITPVGGLLFLAGWALVAIGAWHERS